MKTGIVTQVRMTSTRLPGKVFKLANNKTLLQHHVDRLEKSGEQVYVATTINREDDVIVDFCDSKGIPYFRGSEQDVLSRFSGLAEKFGLSTIVRVTSDCPLIDGMLIKQGLERYHSLKGDNNYLTNCQKRTFPRGFDFEIFSFQSLKLAQDQATEGFEREHVTPYIWKTHPHLFRIEHFARIDNASEYRITVDEPSDYELILKLIEEFNADQLGADAIIQILIANPNLKKINQHVEQKKV